MKTPQQFIKGIINDFVNTKEDPRNISMWKNTAIIQLMDFAKKIGNKWLVQEGLLIILALFNGFLKISELQPSVDLKTLPTEEKRDVYFILNEEFS